MMSQRIMRPVEVVRKEVKTQEDQSPLHNVQYLSVAYVNTN